MLNANNASLNIFVTAATSPLGNETVRQLVARGHHVTGLTDGSEGATLLRQGGALPAYSDPFRAGELRSIIKMANTDVVVHLLNQEGNCFPHKGLDAAAQARIVTDSTAALAEAVRDTAVKFIVYVSDASVYGDRHGEWVDEDAPASGVARQAEEKILSGSVPSCVLRAGTVYGARDPGMQMLGEAAQRGRSVYLGDAHAYRSWVYEADLATAIVRAAETQPAGQVFNIADDTPTHARDFVAYVATNLGMPAPAPLTAPAFALPLLTSQAQRDALNTSVRLKTDKAKQALGWMPRYPSFRPGIDQALMVWRAEPLVREK